MRPIVLLVLIAACKKEPSDSDVADTDTDTDTDTDADTDADTDTDVDSGTGEELVVTASCAGGENALRVTCAVTLSAPGSVTLELSAKGQPTRTFVSENSVTELEILGWGLAPDTTYDWTIDGFAGTVATGPLPATLAAADIRTTGTAFGFDAVLYPMRCNGTDYFTMIDGMGQIVWYEPNDVYFRGIMTGYDWSQATKTVLSATGDQFQEQHVSGDVMLDLAGAGAAFTEILHHDAARWGDYRYLLFEYLVGSLFVDGIYVFEGDVLVGTFLLGDHFTIPGSGNGDWAHGNSLKVTDTGEITLSLHVFHSVLGIDGDPASPTFLQVLWLANGAAGGLPSPTYVPVAGDGFLGQHNVSRHGDDLWVFDNESQPTSRAIRMAIDEVNGTLTETGSWSFDTRCPNQGGAVPIPGGVLASCANVGQVWAFEEASTEPDWTLEADCGESAGPGSLPILRGIPVTIE